MECHQFNIYNKKKYSIKKGFELFNDLNHHCLYILE